MIALPAEDTVGECCGHDHDAALAQHHSEDAVCVDHVSFWWEGKRGQVQGAQPVLDSVTLHVPHRTRLGIVGPNGGGKTTLLRLVLGLLTPTLGRITVFQASPADACRRSLIGYVPQRHDFNPRSPLTVRQVVRMGLAARTGLFRRYAPEDLAHAEHALERSGMKALADRPIGDLSGGQQQRTFIARALAARPRLLVLDEPTVGIDEAGQAQFAELMNRVHHDYDVTTIIVSHDLRAITAGCDQVACLNHRIHFHNAPSGLTREVLSEVFAHNFMGVTPSSPVSTGSAGVL